MTSISKLRLVKAACLAASLLSVGACATITRSPNAEWSVSSMPQGADVTTNMGDHCEATPCTFTVPRKQAFSATVAKPGFLTETVEVDPTVKFEGGLAFMGNAVLGGVVGATIDVFTGAALDPSPNGRLITLVRDRSFDESACTADKFVYAFEVGVPCSSLGGRVAFQASVPAAPKQAATSRANRSHPIKSASLNNADAAGAR